jgi:hypothetical protein
MKGYRHVTLRSHHDEAWRSAATSASHFLRQSNAESSWALRDAARRIGEYWRGTTTCLRS